MSDAIATDGDTAFLGVNQRLQINELKPGEVRESINGRMDGYWKPRKGVVARSAGIATGGRTLTLPFFLLGGLNKTIASATWNAGVVTITTSTAHGLTGTVGAILGNTLAGAVAPLTFVADPTKVPPAGSYLMTVTGVSTLTFAYAAATSTGTYVVSGTNNYFYALPAIYSAAWAASGTSGVMTLTTTSAHGLTIGQIAYATIGNTTVGSVAPLANASNPTKVPPAGSYLMTVVDATTLTFPYTDGATTAYTVSGTTGYLNSQLNDGAVSDIFGSCLYSNPSTTTNEFILIATNLNVKKVLLQPPYTITTIALPPATGIDAECHMLQAFDKVLIFRDGKQALQWNGNDSDRFFKVASGPYTQPSTFTLSTVFLNGTATITVTSGDLISLSASVVGSATSPSVILPAYFDDGSPASEISGYYVGSDIKLNASATTTVTAYDATTRVATLAVGPTVAGTTYAMTLLKTSGAVPGRTFKIVDVPAGLDLIAPNDVFVVASTPLFNTVTYASAETNGTHNIQYTFLESIGGGFSHMPAPPWATYFQRRLWVPYWYEVGGTLTSPTFTNRGIRDEIMGSDILDSDTYDQIMNQFRITAGIADFTVAMQPFFEDGLVVLNRNSIHLISGTQGTLADTVVKELTAEVGCLARKSVAIQGNNVFFLSDNGVYSLTFVDLYNLRGVDMPISVNIQPYIDRINKSLADRATAIYFNNRYFLAVPLDSFVGAANATGNNTVLIYNFLNKGWESIDTYGDARFNILNFHIGKSGQRNALFVVTTTGGVHEMDVTETNSDVLSVDPTSSAISSPIAARLTSRGYDMGTLERKRFTDAQIQMQALDIETDCNLQISFSSQDPDAAEAINTTSILIGEALSNGDTANVRTRLAGIRGFVGTVIIDRISGSPKINSIAVSGAATNRQIITQN
jgi:hypothetical protein